ncbi:ORF027 [Staphylococcus gallinarum]|uniref:ORF027 n=1 Tax=Staphylococcus gallinarum TaxID=1293 RepID=A0A380FKT6_STAGA|nr:ORF027 [Staphylococcus gallinarum]
MEKTKTQLVHRLLAKHFIDNPLNKKCVNHIDGNKTNNNLSNLEWVTYSENNKHAYSTKLKLPSKQKLGAEHVNSKIDYDDVLEIRRKHKYESLGYKKLSDEYGVSVSQIARIVKYESWKHVGKGV